MEPAQQTSYRNGCPRGVGHAFFCWRTFDPGPVPSATQPFETFLRSARLQKISVIFEGYSASTVLGKTLSAPMLPHNPALSPPHSPDLLTTHFQYGFNNLLELNQKNVPLLGFRHESRERCRRLASKSVIQQRPFFFCGNKKSRSKSSTWNGFVVRVCRALSAFIAKRRPLLGPNMRHGVKEFLHAHRRWVSVQDRFYDVRCQQSEPHDARQI